jgi:hypothetical protein
MEDLIQLMSIIDLNSKSFPEGDYLKACNYMKNIYKKVPRATSPEVFIPPRTSHDDNGEFRVVNHHNNERRQLERLRVDIFQYIYEIKRIESRLKYLKIKQRITANVRRDAIRERANQLGFRLRNLTIEELRAKGHQIPDERNFYKSYLERQNLITRGVIDDLNCDLREVNRIMEEACTRRTELETLLSG